MKLGKAKYGAGKKTYYKLKEGDSIYRILPPLGDLADDGIWSIYYRVNYGYTNAAGKSRAFESSLVKNRKSEMIEVPDAAVERLDKLKSSLEAAKAKKDKKAVEALHKLVGAPKSRYNLDSNHYMNVLDTQGNIGILKLRHKAKQALDLVIRKLRDKGIDPLSVDNGRYFVLTRTGMGNETQFAVSVYKKETEIKEQNGETYTVERDVVHKLTDEIIARLSSEAGELQKLFKKPTAEEIQQIVDESDLVSGVSPNIDEILGYKKEEATASTDDNDAEESSAETAAPATDTPGTESYDAQETAAQETEAPVQQAAPVQADNLGNKSPDGKRFAEATAARNEAKAMVPQNTPAPTPAPAKKTTAAAPQTTAEKVADMSDDEFLKSLGIN